MTHFAITVILGITAGFTFVLQGKQWPTFIFATAFGVFLGSTIVGESVKDLVEWIATEADKALAR